MKTKTVEIPNITDKRFFKELERLDKLFREKKISAGSKMCITSHLVSLQMLCKGGTYEQLIKDCMKWNE